MSEYNIELEVLDGLEAIAGDEITEDKHLTGSAEIRPGTVNFRYEGNLSGLDDLRTPTAAYIVLYFDVPRPKALLGHEHFSRLLQHINEITTRQDFETFHINAAGSNSSVMRRIKADIEQHTALRNDDHSGDLLIRIRRRKPGWDVLLRTTPRPLATRSYRHQDMPGALNAPTAYAINRMVKGNNQERYLNLACGTGTLLIEQALHSSVDSVLIGVDYDPAALKMASVNISTAKTQQEIQLVQARIEYTPLASNSINVITADLPFGQRVGSHDANVKLYPAFLAEADRLLRPDGRIGIITHEVRLMHRSLQAMKHWHLLSEQRISLRGLHPRIFLLHKP